jgi:TatD DNase family protein
MMLIDTHAHLYGADFDTDIMEVLERAKANGVTKIFLPAIDSETHDRLLNLCKLSKEGCEIYPMMGLHPCHVKENFEGELAIAKTYLDNGVKYYAVGEIGLDFYWDVSFKDQQIKAFEIQIEWAIERKLPIVIHSRKSTYECIEILKKYKGKVSGIFHCFSGSIEEAREIIKLGFYIGIGGVVTYKNSGLKQVLAEIDLVHVVLETDAPYLTPVPHRGKRNESSYTTLIADEIATIQQISIDEVARITSENALKVFQI